MSSSPPLRLALVNDSPVVVAGLHSILRPYRGRVEVVELDSQATLRADVDLVLADDFAHMATGPLGLTDLVDQAHALNALAVLFGWGDDRSLADRAKAAGADAHLSKNLSPDELVTALEALHAGEGPSPSSADVGEVNSMGDWPGRDEGLSPREAEIVGLIAQGMSNDEIASELYLSINTIKTYVRSAYHKMGVSSRSNAVIWASRHGFLLEPARTQLHGPFS